MAAVSTAVVQRLIRFWGLNVAPRAAMAASGVSGRSADMAWICFSNAATRSRCSAVRAGEAGAAVAGD